MPGGGGGGIICAVLHDRSRPSLSGKRVVSWQIPIMSIKDAVSAADDSWVVTPPPPLTPPPTHPWEHWRQRAGGVCESWTGGEGESPSGAATCVLASMTTAHQQDRAFHGLHEREGTVAIWFRSVTYARSPRSNGVCLWCWSEEVVCINLITLSFHHWQHSSVFKGTSSTPTKSGSDVAGSTIFTKSSSERKGVKASEEDCDWEIKTLLTVIIRERV